jgi:ABC-type oligopeptide transport system substrate-binding subunit
MRTLSSGSPSRDFSRAILEPPLGSGPYRIADFEAGRHVTLERVPDYWGADLPVNRGQYNFDEIRYEYFRDRNAELEALKAGILDLREEFTSKSWATEYNIAAINEGRLIKESLPDETMSGAQGFFINMRPNKLNDVRVRQALNYAFDREAMLEALQDGNGTVTTQVFPPASAAKLAADPAASAFWEAATPSYRRLVVHWVLSAKQEATRERRLAQLIDDCAAGRLVPPQRYGETPKWVERAAAAARAARGRAST